MSERRPSASTIDSGKASATPKVLSSKVRISPPQRSFSTYGRPNAPPHIKPPIINKPKSQTSEEPPLPEQADGGKHPQADQDHAGEPRPPVLLVGIGAEQDEAVLLGDEAPAGALGVAAGLGVGAPDRVEERPVDDRRQAFPQQVEQEQRERRAHPAAEQIVAHPLHRKTIRALYQFMKPEIERLIVRYTAMMMAMPSIACPVWFIVVLAIDTRSG